MSILLWIEGVSYVVMSPDSGQVDHCSLNAGYSVVAVDIRELGSSFQMPTNQSVVVPGVLVWH